MKGDALLDSTASKVIKQIYQHVDKLSLTEFKCWCFELIKQYVPFQSGYWIVASHGSLHVPHTVHLHNQTRKIIENSRKSEALSRLIHDAVMIPGHTQQLSYSKTRNRERTEHSDPYCKQFGLKQGLMTAIQNQTNELYTVITFFRDEAKPEFSKYEKDFIQIISQHLVEAAKLNLSFEVQTNAGTTNQAVCDRHGNLHFIDNGFRSLLEMEWPGQVVIQRLLFDLCPLMEGAEVGVYVGARIIIRISRRGELMYLHAVKDTRNLKLTDRQREICRLVINGSSEKMIAKSLAITPSTVSNHLQNIYKRLGVNSKIQLVKSFPT